jgi:hypothetical protein
VSWRSALPTCFVVSFLFLSGFSQLSTTNDPATLRNVGRSYYEEEKYAEAAQTFEKLLKLRPDSAVDQIDLGIVLVQLGPERYDEARAHLEQGEKLDPKLAPYAAYNLALSYKRQRNFEKAAAEFERARRLDPQCPDTVYNLAVVYEAMRELDKAFEAATRAAELLPDEIAPHYRRMMIAVRLGKTEVANQEKARLTELRGQDARNRTPAELEMSVYTEIVEPERRKPTIGPGEVKPSDVKFVDVTDFAGLAPPTAGPASPDKLGLEWVDVNGDDLADLAWVAQGVGLKIWLNSASGVFKEYPLPADLAALAADGAQAWGDTDNDGDKDACLAAGGHISVLLNDGKGVLSKGPEVEIGEGAVTDLLLVDYDHDGDLDLYVARSSTPPLMLQNDGRGNFAPAPGKTGLSPEKTVTRLAFLDFDDDNDTDFLLTAPGQENILLSNLRVGFFEDVAPKVGVATPADARSVLVSDVNNDEWRDLIFLRNDGEVSVSLGMRVGQFQPAPIGRIEGKSNALASLDYDNDGDEDLWVGSRLFQNDGVFGDVSSAAGLAGLDPDAVLEARPFDYDEDGDPDIALLLRDGSVRLLKNEGGNRNSWLRVRLDGIQSNRFGVATKVEVRAGVFFQRKIAEGLPVLFGLGDRKAVDVLRLWWPTGVAQNLLAPRVGAVTVAKEKLGPPSSCPFVYLWDGRQFSFFTDVLDLTALGVPLDNERLLPHAAKEDLLVPGQLVHLREGKIALQMTGELRELIYLDGVNLSYVDHPAATEVYTLDFSGSPAQTSSDLVEIAGLRPARSVHNELGEDLTSDLIAQDKVYARSGLRLTRFNGLAESHSLTLDFGDLSGLRRPALVLQGWINWIDGDTLFALGQGAGPTLGGPSLEVQTDGGAWRMISENIGTPAGIDKHVVFELPRELCGRSTRLRLRTNLEVYWDRAAVGDLVARRKDAGAKVDLISSNLHFRGFSRIVRDRAGSPPWYDYYQVSKTAPWKPQRGMLTRYGAVSDLLAAVDDRLVVFGPGDELTLVFDSPAPPAPAMKRDYILRCDGWIKDANPSTRTGDTVDPLPTRSMVNYPFDPTPDVSNRDYWLSVDENNTRTLER